MTTRRVVIRLTSEQKRQLSEMAERKHLSMTGMIKHLIDEEYSARWPEGHEEIQSSSHNATTNGKGADRD